MDPAKIDFSLLAGAESLHPDVATGELSSLSTSGVNAASTASSSSASSTDDEEESPNAENKSSRPAKLRGWDRKPNKVSQVS